MSLLPCLVYSRYFFLELKLVGSVASLSVCYLAVPRIITIFSLSYLF